MDREEEIAVSALLHLSNRIYQKSRLIPAWRRSRKRNACKHIARKENPSPNTPLSWSTDKSCQGSDSTPPSAATELQGPLESKRKRKTTVKGARKKMKFAELQDQYVTFSTENARLREEIDIYRRIRESLHADNVFLKNKCPKTKNAKLTELHNHHAVNAKEKEGWKGKQKIEEKFVLPDLNVPLEDPFSA